MKSNDLRIGNLYYYEVQDSQDPRERWLEPSVIDVHDLLYLDTFPDDPAFQPMPINEESILALGGKCFSGKTYSIGKYFIVLMDKVAVLILGHIDAIRIPVGQYIHQLQNIYHFLTGEELPTANFKLPTES